MTTATVADWVLAYTDTEGDGIELIVGDPKEGYTDFKTAFPTSREVWYSILSANGDRESGRGWFDPGSNILERRVVYTTLASGAYSVSTLGDLARLPIHGRSQVGCTFNAAAFASTGGGGLLPASFDGGDPEGALRPWMWSLLDAGTPTSTYTATDYLDFGGP